EREQVAGQLGAAFAGGADHVHEWQRVGLLLEFLGQGIGIADDDRQEIVEVVRDAAGELPDRFEFLGLREAPFQVHPFTDVGVDLQDARRIAVLVPQQRPVAVDGDGLSACGGLLQAPGPFAFFEHLRVGSLERNGLVVRDDVFPALSDRLLARDAVDGFGGTVPVADATIEAAHHDRVPGPVEQGRLLAQPVFALLAVREVGDRAYHAHRAPRGLSEHEAAVVYERVGAVVPAEPVFAGPLLRAAADGFADRAGNLFAIVGMDAFARPLDGAADFFGWNPEQPLQAIVPPDGIVGNVAVPHRVRGGARHVVEAFMAEAEGRLGAHPLGHVLGKHQASGDAAEHDVVGGNLDVDDRTVLADMPPGTELPVARWAGGSHP